MTTAHRPSYNPSRGKDRIFSNPSLQFSARDLPSNTTIKYRHDNANVIDMKKELVKRERESKQGDDVEGIYAPVKKRKIEEENNDNVFPQDKDVEYSEDEDKESVDSEEELLMELENIKKAQLEEQITKVSEIKQKAQNEILKENKK